VIVEVNFAVSVIVFVLIMLMQSAFVAGRGREIFNGFFFKGGQWIAKSRLRTCIVEEAAYLYCIVSLAILFVQIDPAAIGVIILLSLGGAVALPVEVGLSNRHRRNYRPVAELYIARVAYDFEHHDRSTTLETLRALVQESHCSEDARIALQTLLQREDRLSELARDVMFRYSQ